MNKKGKMIVCLLFVAVLLSCAIEFWAIPSRLAKEADYARGQTDALTHDIAAIEDFKNPYIGNTSNVCRLFEALPLYNVSKRFEINSETCALTVYYLDAVGRIGDEKVRRDLIYNSAAAMAAIDNLSGITYHFSGDRYSFDRAQLEKIFGRPLSNLLEREAWDKEVRGPLGSADFVEQFFK